MRQVPVGQHVAHVSDGDFEQVMEYRWHISPRPNGILYARRSWRPDPSVRSRQRSQYMHVLITGWPQTDHKDHDGLNNVRSNLRAATSVTNARNARPIRGGSSIYRGVGWDRRRERWRAYIYVDSRQLYLGSSSDETEAALLFNAAAVRYFGEFACLNDVLA